MNSLDSNTMRDSEPRADRFVLELEENTPLEFQWIPPGEFYMGSYGEQPYAEPRHRVRITNGFYLGIFPVTQAQFAVWATAEKIEHENHFSNKPKNPAENLNWREALSFCQWLNNRHGQALPAGYRATLPTEAHWEYACRAGTETEYCTGDGAAALNEAGWFDEDGNSESTSPVGQKRANAWGLFDMHGNVWEWCLDEWDAEAYKRRCDGVTDPVVGSEAGEYRDRVVRGGSWSGRAGICRSAFRFGWSDDFRFGYRGFRACLVPGLVEGRAQVK